jgi:hypothetical protein
MEATMPFRRPCLTAVLSFALSNFTPPATSSPAPPLGILTQAYQAHVDEALAFPGLSFFEGEELSTDREGRIGARVGHSTLNLSGNTEATVFHITNGIHVDLTRGAIYFTGGLAEVAEIHVGEALMRTVGKPFAQATITLLLPSVLQVTAIKGGVDFTYREEYRYLPQGQTYRIYLDAPDDPQVQAIASSQGRKRKVAYFILGAGAAGGTAWGIQELVAVGNPPISPAKP